MISSSLLATINLSLGGLVFLLGLVILRENPRQRLNRVVALMLFFGGIGSIFAAMSLFPGAGAASRSAATRGHIDALENLSALWEFFFPSLFVFASLFPVERRYAMRWRRFAFLVYAPYLAHFMLLVAMLLMGGDTRPILQTSALQRVDALADLVGVVTRLFIGSHRFFFSFINLGVGIVAAILLVNSYRHARVARVRQQLRVIGAGLITCLALYSVASSVPILLAIYVSAPLRALLVMAALLAGSASIAFAIVQYKFLDTKLLARRGILYAIASALMVGLYLVIVGRMQEWAGRTWALNARIIEPVFLIVALILFQPAIAWLEDMLERAFLRDPGDYRSVLRRLGPSLLTTLDADDLLSTAAHTIGDALVLRVAHAVAFARDNETLVQTGAGAPLRAEAAARVRNIVGRLPSDRDFFRSGDLADVLSNVDRAFLVETLEVGVILPLHARGGTVGALLLGNKITGTSYTSEDEALLSALAGQMSLSLQNALLFRERVAIARIEEELELARRIQRSFQVTAFPDSDTLDVYAATLPAKHVGGDLYDVIRTVDGGLFLAIADVSGKGVPAALLSAMLQAAIRTQVETTSSIANIVQSINNLIFRSTSTEQFATFVLVHVDEGSGRLSFTNAGHNWPVVLRRSGDSEFLDRGGLILGIREDETFDVGSIALQAGDRVVFYTDGISEAMNALHEQFGEDRLCDVLRRAPADATARDIAEFVLGELRAWLAGEEPRDDITLLVLRVLQPTSVPSGGTLLTAEACGESLA